MCRFNSTRQVWSRRQNEPSLVASPLRQIRALSNGTKRVCAQRRADGTGHGDVAVVSGTETSFQLNKDRCAHSDFAGSNVILMSLPLSTTLGPCWGSQGSVSLPAHALANRTCALRTTLLINGPPGESTLEVATHTPSCTLGTPTLSELHQS